MQIKQHPSTDYLHAPYAAQVAAGGLIVTKLTENATQFPALPVPVATLSATNASYLSLIEKAKTGDHSFIHQRNNQAKVWKLQFKQTTDYVDQVANGNAAVISDAGMTPTKAETAPRQAPLAPEDWSASPTGQPGGAEISVRPDRNVDAYLYIAMPEDAHMEALGNGLLRIDVGTSHIFVKCDTHSGILMEGLTSHLPLKVAVQPVNNAGAGPMASNMPVTPQ